jgi:3-deoxy-D-manno-octulosonate 8-phosphate phosphatase (KDO 8-P phosphatase)
MKIKPKHFIVDVDGVMTDGKLYYTASGKIMKVFGPDDHDALSLLNPYLNILFVTGDHRGLPITKRRIVRDMKMRLELVSTVKRIDWIAERFNPKEVIYMGDGIFDPLVFAKVGYSISTADADEACRKKADFVTKSKGSERAVAQACLHILQKFFIAYNPLKLPCSNIKASGKWGI